MKERIKKLNKRINQIKISSNSQHLNIRESLKEIVSLIEILVLSSLPEDKSQFKLSDSLIKVLEKKDS